MIGRALYLSAIGLAGETLQLHRQLNHELVHMTFSATRAVQLQTAAVESQAASQELVAAAARDEAAAAALQAEAVTLEEKSAADQAAAAAKEAWAEELAQVAAEETREAEGHLAKAVVEDAAAKEELVAGAGMAEAALETSTEAHVDEAVVGLCQFIPAVSVVCDFVGGLAATTLELTAAAEAAEATADFAAAMAAKEQEAAELALAAELQAQAVAEGVEMAAAQEQALVLEEQAQVEAADAAQDELEAQEETAKSAAESEAAATEEAAAAEQELAAEQALAKSVQHGIKSAFCAVLQLVSALGVMAFFAARLVGGVVLPAMLTSAVASTSGSSSGAMFFAGSMWSTVLLSVSCVLHAAGILVLVAVTYDVILENPDQQSRGETIVEIALASMLLQALVLHVPTIVWTTCCREPGEKGRCRFRLGHLLHLVADLVLLFCWNAFGCFVLSSQIEALPQGLVFFYLGPMLLCTLALHHWHQTKHLSRKEEEMQQQMYDPKKAASEPTERTLLLGDAQHAEPRKLQQQHHEQSQQHQESAWFKLRHSLLFELLVTFVLFAVLWSCLSRTAILRPFWGPAKTALWSLIVRFKWQLLMGVGAVVGMFLLTVAAMVAIRQLRKRRTKPEPTGEPPMIQV